MTAQLVRLAETDRPAVPFRMDGRDMTALAGDTVVTAILTNGASLRAAEFGPERRAGFCLMGACQDCWIWAEDGSRLRACSTPVEAGMRLLSAAPAGWPR